MGASAASSDPEPAGKGVVVTGASSGIGHAVALGLARAGFTVLGAVRREADAARLARLGEPNLVPVGPLDLSRREQIPPAVRRVREDLGRLGVPLCAVVNDAGGGTTAPVEMMDLDTLRLRGQLPGAHPGHRAQALGDPLHPGALRRHPHPRPGAGGSGAGGGAGPVARRAARPLRRRIGRVRRELAEFDRRRSDRAVVAEAVRRALTARRPRRRYQVGYMSHAGALLEGLPQGLVDRIMAGRAGAG